MKIICFPLAMLLCFGAYGQVFVHSSAPTTYFKPSVILRKAIENKDDKDKPAMLSLTFPKGKENSFLLNAGLGVSLLWTKVTRNAGSTAQRQRWLELIPSLVYNRNTEIEKIQNNVKGVLAATYLKGHIDTASKTHGFFKAYPTLQYMRNKVDTTSSYFATAYFTWVLKEKGFMLSNYWALGNSGIDIFLSPALGIEYKDRFEVKKPTQAGTVTRFYYGGDFRIAINIGKEEIRSLNPKAFEIILTYAGRKELSSTMKEKEGDLYLFKSEFAVYPLLTDKVSFSLLRSDGADPIAALPKQEFWQFAIKLKLDYPLK